MKLIDRTPDRFRCEVGPSCPAVFETDECSYGISCPAVLPEQNGKFVIIGKRLYAQNHPELRGRIGPDEAAIEIDAALLREALTTGA